MPQRLSMPRALLMLALLASTPAVAGRGDAAVFSADRAQAASRAAVGRTLAAYRLVDRRGRAVELAEWRGRPLLISLIYTSCHHSCSTLTRQLARAVGIAREALGEDSFAVLSVGFDTANDTPERMAAYARAQGIDQPGWRFLSAERATVERLARDLGFLYAPSPRGFDHTAQVTLLDQQGRVYRQIYTDYLTPPVLVEPLKQLVFGRRADATSLSGWLNGVRLLCTVYDPNSGRYTFDYSIFVAACVGALCLGAVAAFVVCAWREPGAGRERA